MSVLLMMPCRPSAFLSRSVGGLRRLFSAEISIPLKTGLLPFSPPLTSCLCLFFLPSLFLHPFSYLSLPTLSLIHCQEGPYQKGPFSVSWQQQRLAAPAASTVSPEFILGGQGCPYNRQLAGFGEEPPCAGGCCQLRFDPLFSWGASVNIHGGSLPKPLVCL